MTTKISSAAPATPRIPPAHGGIQYNACKNPKCENFGVPAPEKASRGVKGLYAISGGGKDLPLLKCNVCGETPPLKSNVGIAEEIERLGAYLREDEPPFCPNGACDDGAVELPKRLGFQIKPSFNGLVVVSKNARVSRPKTKGWWDDGIVKADQVKARIDKTFDSDNNIFTAAKIIGSDTLETFARGLAALHVPASFDWHAKFGLPREVVAPVAKPAQVEPVEVKSEDKPEPKKSGRVCHSCGEPVEDKVVTFCIRFNKARFGGNVYCQDCQKAIPKPA